MNRICVDHLAALKAAIAHGLSVTQAVPRCVGGLVTAGGMWRFFSPHHPACGIAAWNAELIRAWLPQQGNILAVGEDLFGNQLTLPGSKANVHLSDHENNSCCDLQVGAVDLLDAVMQHGVGWLDFYTPDLLHVAERFVGRVSWEQHLHWTQPLILGGAVSVENVSIVDRLAHLVGHAELWKQMSGLPPGTEVVPGQ